MKKCSKCKKYRPIDMFHKNKASNDGVCNQCKICVKENHKRYYIKNKHQIDNQNKINRNNNKWWGILSDIKRRCNNINFKHYKYYGGRGIKCLITSEELKKLWFRDKAYEMKKPSIDRIDNDGDYEYDNCRFIELAENVVKMNTVHHKKKKIYQYDLDGTFIKEWDSITDAEKKFGGKSLTISGCINNRYKTAHKYIWKMEKI